MQAKFIRKKMIFIGLLVGISGVLFNQILITEKF